LATAFIRGIGYRGIVDLDWRFDSRDGQYKLLDFNPRVGANFGMFETDTGIDVVRAMHLDLTGRPIPDGTMNEGQSLIVEHLDIASRLAARRERQPNASKAERGKTRFSWLALDDPLPVTAAAALSGRLAVAKLGTTFHRRGGRRA
jgi:predicted ATP-grasp superfamily ATP-dependent carboligase